MPVVVSSLFLVLEKIEFKSEHPMVVKFVIALAAWETSSTISQFTHMVSSYHIGRGKST